MRYVWRSFTDKRGFMRRTTISGVAVEVEVIAIWWHLSNSTLVFRMLVTKSLWYIFTERSKTSSSLRIMMAMQQSRTCQSSDFPSHHFSSALWKEKSETACHFPRKQILRVAQKIGEERLLKPALVAPVCTTFDVRNVGFNETFLFIAN